MTDDLHDPATARAVGVAIAARHSGSHEHDELDLPRRAAKAYRTAMHRFTDASYREIWCAHLDVNEIFRSFADPLTKKDRSRSTAPPWSGSGATRRGAAGRRREHTPAPATSSPRGRSTTPRHGVSPIPDR